MSVGWPGKEQMPQTMACLTCHEATCLKRVVSSKSCL
jgi:hypothetical protein